MKKFIIRLAVVAVVLLGLCYWLGFFPFERTLTGDVIIHHDIKEGVWETVYDIKSFFRNAVPEMKQAVRETADEVRETVRELKEDARELVFEISH